MIRQPTKKMADKAARLLSTGSVSVLTADQTMVVAAVHGDSGTTYQVSWTRESGWRCGCPAPIYGYRECAHILAVEGCTGRDLTLVATRVDAA
jgi:uncharacterized Zn finger protein